MGRLRGFTPGVQVMATLSLAAAGCTSAERIDAPPPLARTGWVDRMPSPALSEITVPVSYDLQPALEWMESSVPKDLGNMNERMKVPDSKRLTYAFEASRGPFDVTVDGRTVTISAVVHYRAKGWYKPPLLPTLTGSCGVGSPAPRLRITITTTVNPTPEWAIRAKTRVPTLRPLTQTERDKCKVTAANVDLTDKVVKSALSALKKVGRDVDRQIMAFPLRTEAELVWNLLSQPIRLTDSLWLLIDPTAVRLASVEGHKNRLVSGVGVSAFPRIVSGPQPQPTTRPLPPLEETPTNPKLALLTQGTLTYSVTTDLLREKLRGKRLSVSGRNLEIRDIKVSGLGDGRLVIGLEVSGPADGHLYAVGTPQFDSVTSELYMPDLAFDLATSNLFVRGLAWLKHQDFQNYLRQKVRISVVNLLEDGQRVVERELNRDLAPGVHLTTTLAHGRVLRVRASPYALLVDAVVDGRSELQVTLRPAGIGPTK